MKLAAMLSLLSVVASAPSPTPEGDLQIVATETPGMIPACYLRRVRVSRNVIEVQAVGADSRENGEGVEVKHR